MENKKKSRRRVFKKQRKVSEVKKKSLPRLIIGPHYDTNALSRLLTTPHIHQSGVVPRFSILICIIRMHEGERGRIRVK